MELLRPGVLSERLLLFGPGRGRVPGPVGVDGLILPTPEFAFPFAPGPVAVPGEVNAEFGPPLFVFPEFEPVFAD